MRDKILFKLREAKRSIFAPSFKLGVIKTPEQIRDELFKLKWGRVSKLLRHRKYEGGADDVLFKMMDTSNLATISLVLNWALGEVKQSPVETILKSIEQRRALKRSGKKREHLIAVWLQNHNIDKNYLEQIITKVANSSKKPKKKSMEEQPQTPAEETTAEAPAEAPAEQPAEAPAEQPAEQPAEAPEETPAEAPAEAPTSEAGEEAPSEPAA